VHWVAGLPHRGAPNVLAGSSKGKWRPASGYRWVNSDPDDLRVAPGRQGGQAGAHGGTGEAYIQRTKDVAALGLDEGAAAAQIEAAFRRLAKLHHPDRYVREGVEAVEQATLAFRMVRTAYERIKSAHSSRA